MQEEIERILNLPEVQMLVEQAMPPQDSPLNQPVAEKHFEQAPPAPESAPTADVPIEMLQLAAHSILTTFDNVIALGAGYFVKIKRHKEFFELEEVIQLIDAQNEKNVNAMKLDEGGAEEADFEGFS